jgi:hypothetical protein
LQIHTALIVSLKAGLGIISDELREVLVLLGAQELCTPSKIAKSSSEEQAC